MYGCMVLELLGGWMASSNFRLVLLFLIFCDKNGGLVTLVPVTVAEREHKPGAAAVVIHPLNNTVLNPPVSTEASLQ